MNLIPLFINMKLDINGLSALLALTRNPQRVSAGAPRGAPGTAHGGQPPWALCTPLPTRTEGERVAQVVDKTILTHGWPGWHWEGTAAGSRVGQTLEEQTSLPVSVHTTSQAGGDGQGHAPPPTSANRPGQ